MNETLILDALTIKIVNKLFLTFEGIFPAFKSGYGSQKGYENAKREWVKTLLHAGLSDINQIKIGVNKCRLLESQFMLSAGKFVSLCGIIKNEGRCRVPMFESQRNRIPSKLNTDIAFAEIEKMKQGLKK